MAIDHDHLQEGLPCKVIPSDMGGRFEVGWTFDDNDETMTEEHALTGWTFGLLWDGVAAPVSEGGVSWAWLVIDPACLIDRVPQQIISATQV